MIATDERAVARSAVESCRRDVAAAQAELDGWLSTRHEQGHKATAIDLTNLRIVAATAVDARSWANREGLLRANAQSARSRLEDAEERLRNLRLHNLLGERVRVHLFHTV